MQQVNLYQAQFRERREPLGIAMLAGMLVLFIILLAAASILQSRQTNELVTRAQELQTRQQALTETLNQVTTRIAARRADPALADRVEDLRGRLRDKQQLAGSLKNLAHAGASGFSAHLAGVARQRVDGLWFTGVDLEQGGQLMGLYGTTLQAGKVAAFVGQLKHEAVFAGAHFNVLKLARGEHNPDWLEFSLQTKRTERE